MDTEQSPAEPGPAPEANAGTFAYTSRPSSPAPSPGGTRLQSIALGAATMFIVGSLLYGVQTTVLAAGLLVVCTIGIGLIPLVAVAWIVGAVELLIWDAFRRGRRPEGPSAAAGDPGG